MVVVVVVDVIVVVDVVVVVGTEVVLVVAAGMPDVLEPGAVVLLFVGAGSGLS